MSILEAAAAGKLKVPIGKGVPDLFVAATNDKGQTVRVKAADTDSLKLESGDSPWVKVELQDAKGKVVKDYAPSAPEPLSTVEIEAKLQTLKGKALDQFMKDYDLGKRGGKVDYGARAEAKKTLVERALKALEDHLTEVEKETAISVHDVSLVVYKAGVRLVIKAIKAGQTIKAAIDAAIDHMRKAHTGPTPFNEQELRQRVYEKIVVVPPGYKERETITRIAAEGPDNLYAPQAQVARETGTAIRPDVSIADMQTEAAATSTEALIAKAMSSQNDIVDRVPAALEAMERLKAEGKTAEAQTIFDELIAGGSNAGVILRTMAMVKGASPEGMVDAVRKITVKLGAPATEKQFERWKGLATEDLAARTELKRAEQAALAEPSAENRNALEIAKLKADKASKAFMSDVAEAVPKSVADTIFKIMQGNVMSTMSHVYNLTGNMVNQPVRGAVDLVASAIDMARSALTKTAREVSGPGVGRRQYWQGMRESRKQVQKILREGTQQYGSPVAGEIYEGLHPARAWARLLGLRKRAENIKGIKKASGILSDVIEGFPTAGPAAEITFRVLAAVDAPFKAAKYRKALAQIGYRQGLRGKELDTFVGTAKNQKQAMDEALESVYQQQTRLTKVVGDIAKFGRDIPVVGKWLNLALRTATGNLFTNTPTNIIAEWVQLAVPPVAFAKAAVEIKSGNTVAAEQSIARGLIGAALSSVAISLVQSGYATGSGTKTGDEKELRKQSGQPSNTFNLSAFRRRDGKWREGDTVVKYSNIGFPGLLLGMYANAGETLSQEALKQGQPAQPSKGDMVLQSAQEVPVTILQNLSMVKGQQIFYDALAQQQYGKVAQNMWNLYTSIPIPNTIVAAENAARKYQVNVDSENTVTELGNIIKTKLGITDDLPPKRNVWGVPIKSTPEGATPWVYQFLNFTKSQRIPSDEESQLVWDVVRAAPDRETRNQAIPTAPGRRFEKTNLTDEQLDFFEAKAGTYRKQLVRENAKTIRKELENGNAKVAAKLLDRIYTQGRKLAEQDMRAKTTAGGMSWLKRK